MYNLYDYTIIPMLDTLLNAKSTFDSFLESVKTQVQKIQYRRNLTTV